MCNCGTELKQLNTFFLRFRFLASERRNLHDDLCLIDPPVFRFDGESVKMICIK